MSSVQQFTEILDIRDGIVCFRDGTYSAYIEVSPINVGLKSGAEQLRIHEAFRVFLDTLRYPVQLVVRKTPHSIADTLAYLQECFEQTTNPTLRKFLLRYRQFIIDRGASAEFFDQHFYVVVSWRAVETLPDVRATRGIGNLLNLFGKPARPRAVRSDHFAQAQKVLTQRVDSILPLLEGVGLHPRVLTTEEIVAIFYSIYSPEHYAIRASTGGLTEYLRQNLGSIATVAREVTNS